MLKSVVRMGVLASAAVLGAAPVSTAQAAWEPTRPVEIVVPAGPGGGADQMARVVQGIVTKHGLMKQSLIVVNKAGGAGGEGFLDVKGSRANPHKLIITLSNLFTTPLATGIPFNWKDLTPVAMLALDEFVLWVNADKPYKIGQGLYRRGQGGASRHVQDGRHRLQAGRPDHHRRGREGRERQVHLHPLQGRRRSRGAARRRPRQLHREQPDRSGGAVERPARSVRSACSTARSSTTPTRSRATLAGTASRPASRRDSTWST